MIMKRLVLLFCVAMLTIAASAQITWNVKAGGGIATMWGSDTNGMKPHVVAKIGVGIEKPISSNLSIMPSLEVAWKGFKFDTEEQDLGYGMTRLGATYNIDLLYVQIPILAAYRLPLSSEWNMTLKAGPYVAYCVYDHVKVSAGGSSLNFNNEMDIKKFDAGIDAGFDFEYHRFVFGVEAEMGFLSIGGSDGDYKNLAFYATIGYKF